MHVFKYLKFKHSVDFFGFYFSSGVQQYCDHCTNNNNNIHNILANGPQTPVNSSSNSSVRFVWLLVLFLIWTICDFNTCSAVQICGYTGVCDWLYALYLNTEYGVPEPASTSFNVCNFFSRWTCYTRSFNWLPVVVATTIQIMV